MVAILGLTRCFVWSATLVLQAGIALADQPVRRRVVSAPDGVRIAYETHGRGEVAVVLVHGWSGDRTYWKEQVARLAAKFQVVTVDLAGHGASGRNRKAWTIAAFGGAPPALVERVVADMSSAPPAVALPAMEAAISYDREMPGALGALGLPVVVINPDRPPSDAVALARHGVALELMSGVGHFPMLEAPARFNELLTKTVERMPWPEAARP